MNCMCKINLNLACVVIIFGLLAAAETKAQVNAGGGLAYGTEVEGLGLHLNGFYDIPNHEEIRAGAEFTYYFPESFDGGSVRYSEFNINGHYRFFENDDIAAYGLGGLNYMTYTVSYDENFLGFSGGSTSKVGLNIGAGAEYGVNFGSLFGELKFVISDFDQLVISFGARIPFEL